MTSISFLTRAEQRDGGEVVVVVITQQEVFGSDKLQRSL